MVNAGKITLGVEMHGLDRALKMLGAFVQKLDDGRPTPCPICYLPGGFHDHDDDWTESRHLAHSVPRDLCRPSNSEVKRQRQRATAAARLEALRGLAAAWNAERGE
jgi:hypothetical protein